ncbi:MAG: SAM-dependent methyltransferase [Roseibacillus sp.]
MSCPPSSNRKAHSPFPRFMELALYHGEHGYYSNPACTCGTLQTYARHRAGDDPLDAPGQRDLTTHLDFTSVREAAAAAGLQSLGSTRQESYLVHLAHDLLHDLSPRGEEPGFPAPVPDPDPSGLLRLPLPRPRILQGCHQFRALLSLPCLRAREIRASPLPMPPCHFPPIS